MLRCTQVVKVEHLCASRGLSVLNESLLESSKILILLLGASNESLPLGAAFHVPADCQVVETPWIAMDCPIVNVIKNVNEQAENTDKGVWICGTDAFWKIKEPKRFSFARSEIAAFCFEGRSSDCQSHGVYELDEEVFTASW
ncbi:hypothetical protein ANCCAN_25483 [Ancylostoma caninum]|uniref:Uncharacterized protein n=1 Tax=Ancylostoma caninum TaxID=29170 RepID=A0A368F9D0_ANCCA|nr:hypothetical protein ANCCAN_25483 [Ancylostoma caninum]